MKETVLITGCNRGIGLELVRQFAEKGMHVIATCRNPDKAVELQKLAALNANIVVEQLNVTEDESIKKLSKKYESMAIDILINNAGANDQNATPFGNIDTDKWLELFKINTLAPIKMTEAFIENFKKVEKPRVCMISTTFASMVAMPIGGNYLYRTSKAALNSAVVALSHDLKNHGIIPVLIHPGWVKTDMGGKDAQITTQESVQGIIKVIFSLSLEDSGKFFNYDGTIVPW